MTTAVRRVSFPILFAVLAMALVACSNSKTETGKTDEQAVKVSYRDITSELPDMRYEKADNFVLRSEAKLLEHIEAHSDSLFSTKSVPDIDFNKDMVVVIAVGPRSSAGYRLKPVSVHAEGDKTMIRAKELTPPPDSIAAEVITYPHLALVVPKRTGPVEVKVTSAD